MNLLAVGAKLDYISPTLHFIELIRGKKGIAVDIEGTGLTGRDVIRLLKRHGIQVGLGAYLVGWSLVLTVSSKEDAIQVLNAHGIGMA